MRTAQKKITRATTHRIDRSTRPTFRDYSLGSYTGDQKKDSYYDQKFETFRQMYIEALGVKD